MPTVADARKDFTDLLGRAHYADELIPIFRRNTPYARIVSEKAGKFVEKADKIAKERGLDSRDSLLEEVDQIEQLRIAMGLGSWDELKKLMEDIEPAS